MTPVRSLRFVLPVLAAAPLAAQSRLGGGAGVGLAVQTDTRFKSSIFGPALQGFLTRRLSSRLSIRSELLASYFPASAQAVFMYPPVAGPCTAPGCQTYTVQSPRPLGVGSLTVGAVVDDTGSATNRSYLIVGGGLFGAYQHPAGDHRLFPGVDVGLGSRLGHGSTRFEMRYHWVPGWKGGGLSFGWMGVGRTF
jgi:hypothetical protein